MSKGNSGCYWAKELPKNKAEWRGNYAVKDLWNDNGYYVEHAVGPDGLKVWEGKTAGQEYLEHQGMNFHLEGPIIRQNYYDNLRIAGIMGDNILFTIIQGWRPGELLKESITGSIDEQSLLKYLKSGETAS